MNYATALHKHDPLLQLKQLTQARRWYAAGLAICALVLMPGCANQISRPSKLMQKAEPEMGTPPAGKSLVIIHRPRGANGDFTDVWDSTHLIAELGSGNSVAYEQL